MDLFTALEKCEPRKIYEGAVIKHSWQISSVVNVWGWSYTSACMEIPDVFSVSVSYQKDVRVRQLWPWNKRDLWTNMVSVIPVGLGSTRRGRSDEQQIMMLQKSFVNWSENSFLIAAYLLKRFTMLWEVWHCFKVNSDTFGDRAVNQVFVTISRGVNYSWSGNRRVPENNTVD